MYSDKTIFDGFNVSGCDNLKAIVFYSMGSITGDAEFDSDIVFIGRKSCQIEKYAKEHSIPFLEYGTTEVLQVLLS